jgi:hypothetical protein
MQVQENLHNSAVLLCRRPLPLCLVSSVLHDRVECLWLLLPACALKKLSHEASDHVHTPTICRLTNNLRALLRRYEQRPPPLSPLAATLRGVCTLTANPETVDSTPR